VLRQHEVVRVDAVRLVAGVVNVVTGRALTVVSLPHQPMYLLRTARPIDHRADRHLRPNPGGIQCAGPEMAARLLVLDDVLGDAVQHRTWHWTATAKPGYPPHTGHGDDPDWA
jgi:hypothetical protein